MKKIVNIAVLSVSVLFFWIVINTFIHFVRALATKVVATRVFG